MRNTRLLFRVSLFALATAQALAWAPAATAAPATTARTPARSRASLQRLARSNNMATYTRTCNGVKRIYVPDTGLKDGLILDMVDELERRGMIDARSQEIRAAALGLGERYRVDRDHATLVTDLALSLFDQLTRDGVASPGVANVRSGHGIGQTSIFDRSQ